MDEYSEIWATKVGEWLKDLMKVRGITAEDLIKSGINKQQIYAVLRMGKPQRPDYQISTFIKVLSALKVHIEFHDMNERTNFDLTGKAASKN